MSDPYVAQISTFAFGFAPRGYALCQGQLLAISSNDALYSLIGTIYGGDGRTSFALPDMRGRLPMHEGQGPGLSFHPIGARFGMEDVFLSSSNLPTHTHAVKSTDSVATEGNATNAVLATAANLQSPYGAGPASGTLDMPTLSNAGGNQPHNNMMPSLTINFSIALYGVYPSRH